MSTPRTGAAADRLHALLEPVVAATGRDLESVKVTPMGRQRLVEVVVDADGGVSLDAVAEVTRVVSDVLDGPEADAILGEQPYRLEVSSPGTDRPLTAPRHWRRAKTRLVKVQVNGGGELVGRVLDSDDEGVLLEVPSKNAVRTAGKAGPTTEQRRLGYSEIGKARVEIEFSRKGEEDLIDEDLVDDDVDDEDGEDGDPDDGEHSRADGRADHEVLTEDEEG